MGATSGTAFIAGQIIVLPKKQSKNSRDARPKQGQGIFMG
jgi:hypothetical protein